MLYNISINFNNTILINSKYNLKTYPDKSYSMFPTGVLVVPLTSGMGTELNSFSRKGTPSSRTKRKWFR